ncbi:hypothetical protein, partial [Aurantimonas coralicida]|uniref:hypothetical protein n=1 Tax=Aurantimonas coralicida TaxID=182270 RepID=UPI00238E0B4C
RRGAHQGGVAERKTMIDREHLPTTERACVLIILDDLLATFKRSSVKVVSSPRNQQYINDFNRLAPHVRGHLRLRLLPIETLENSRLSHNTTHSCLLRATHMQHQV